LEAQARQIQYPQAGQLLRGAPALACDVPQLEQVKTPSFASFAIIWRVGMGRMVVVFFDTLKLMN
jgi:hypothetical protein